MKNLIKAVYHKDKKLAQKVAAEMGCTLTLAQGGTFTVKKVLDRGKQALRAIKELKTVLPASWELSDAVVYWQKLKGAVPSQKVQRCLRKPPDGVDQADVFCEKLGQTMYFLGV